MMSGGHEVGMGEGGRAQLQIHDYHRANFLLVKLSTVDLVNVWGPGYHWS